MSDEDLNGGSSGNPGKPRVGLLILAVLGALMLLPGACGLIATAMALSDMSDPYVQAVFIISIPSIVVGGLGLWLLTWAVKKYRRNLG